MILTRVESDELTSNMETFSGSILNTINGEAVTNMSQAYKLLYETEQPEFTVMEFEDKGRPLAIPSASALKMSTSASCKLTTFLALTIWANNSHSFSLFV